MGALLSAVMVQQNDAATEWLANDLAEVSEQFTARKIVFMAPASRARDALHAVDEHRGDALLLNEGSEPDDIDESGIDRQELLSWSIQTLMAAAGQAMQQKNPGAVVSAIRQLDHMTGTGYNSHRGQLRR